MAILQSLTATLRIDVDVTGGTGKCITDRLSLRTTDVDGNENRLDSSREWMSSVHVHVHVHTYTSVIQHGVISYRMYASSYM